MKKKRNPKTAKPSGQARTALVPATDARKPKVAIPAPVPSNGAIQDKVLSYAADRPDFKEISTADSYLYFGKPYPYNRDDLVGKKGLKIYAAMVRDEQIKAALGAAQLACLSTGYEIVPAESDEEDAGEDDARNEQADFLQFNFDEMEGSINSKLVELYTARQYGFSLAEKVWWLVDYGEWSGRVGLKDLKFRNPVGIDFDADEYGNLAEDGILQATRRMPSDKFLLWSYRKKFGNHYGDSDLRDCYRAYWQKDVFLRMMAIALERYGEPMLHFQHSGILNAGMRTKLEQIINNLSSKTGFVTPDSVKATILGLGRGAAEAFVPALKHMDMLMRLALLIPGLIGFSGEEDVGSLARSQTHFDAFLMFVGFLRGEMETVINEQVTKQLVDYNWEVTDGRYPKFQFNIITQEYKERMFKIWQDAVVSGALTKTREDENRQRERLEMPPLSDDVPMKLDTAMAPTLPRFDADGNPISPAPQKPFTKKSFQKRAQTAYEQRVDFEAAKRVLDDDALEHDQRIRQVLKRTLRQVTDWVEQNAKSLTPEKITQFRVDSGEPLRKEIRDLLTETWRKGRDQATKELPPKLRAAPEIKQVQKFSGDWGVLSWLVAPARPGDIDNYRFSKEAIEAKLYQIGAGFSPTDALNAFNARAWLIEAVLDDRLRYWTQLELFEHLKGGRPMIETIKNIREIFEPYVGDPTAILPSGPGVPEREKILEAYRLENIVRTESAWAYNQGRVAVADAAGDYVIGFFFSAILDERTTEVCQAADGLTFRKDDPRAIKLTPGLHWQALPQGTLVWSSPTKHHSHAGWHLIENIRVGWSVFTHKRRWRSVTETMCHQTWPEELVLHLEGGRTLSITEEHPVLTSRGWVNAKNLTINDQVICIAGPCATCGTWTRGKFCSIICKSKAQRIKRDCRRCGTEIAARRYKGKYSHKPKLFCSNKCKFEAMRQLRGYECLNCKKPLIGSWKNPLKRDRRFCSFHCYHVFKGETTIEKIVRLWLEAKEIKFVQYKQFGRYTVDFYIPSWHVALEADGEYWHGKAGKPQKIQLRRQRYLLKRGLIVVRLPERAVKSGRFASMLAGKVRRYEKTSSLFATSEDNQGRAPTLQ